ncbi:hypothetical protein NQ315_001181 [Exocentrus adspersus]|uniref:C2H2-type domain-containing protein n=1 Tax=Exocentrus adspersus TaxID=1586481 RepID=A0AAV8WE79_9CUCU|nr:hypothetical protein NQ315_001181 [Exocentrus adspersus]
MSDLQNPNDIKRLCRVCLSQGKRMVLLDRPFKEGGDTFTVLQMLEFVMCAKDIPEQDDTGNDPDEAVETIYIDYVDADSETTTLTVDEIQTTFAKKPMPKTKHLDEYFSVSNANPSPLTPTANTGNLSLDEELFQAAFNMQYECPACPKVYSSKRNFERHTKVCKKLNSPTGNKDYSVLFKCNTCCLSYRTKKELDIHWETIHGNFNKEVVPEVSLDLDTLSELDRELFRAAMELKYNCDSCTRVYSSFAKLNRHKETCVSFKRRKITK